MPVLGMRMHACRHGFAALPCRRSRSTGGAQHPSHFIRNPDAQAQHQHVPALGLQPTWPAHARQIRASAASLDAASETARAAIPDQRLAVKLGLAASTGRLDLTDFRLEELPAELFELRELEDLSLAGNCLTHLPEQIGQLTSLKRLQLAGNQLTQLPPTLGKLSSLEGLWLGGNLLATLPSELGNLASLRQFSISGNQVRQLPATLGSLSKLEELEAAGNLLEEIPEELGTLGALRKLSLNGNCLTSLPETLGSLASLQELWLMGNQLAELPAALANLPSLRQLSVADNALRSLSPTLGNLPRLEKLWAYGNQLQGIQSVSCFQGSTAGGRAWPALDGAWLEGNPLGPEAAELLVHCCTSLPRLKSLGLDLSQLVGVEPDALRSAGAKLKLGEVLGTGPGYFKLAPSPLASVGSSGPGRAPGMGATRAIAAADATAVDDAAAGEASVAAVTSGRIQQKPVLVVSFGSAPGVPNWGGLLGRLYKSAQDWPDNAGFDVLYVVDPVRGWYEGGDGEAVASYASRLEQYTSRYKHVVMLGDSMGATAALLFCEQATAVLAFCPQVDLSTASIRPGQPAAWLDSLRDRVIAAVAATGAEVTALVGTWQHDLDQTKLLPADKARVKVYSLDSHRLALYLDQRDKLLPLVRDAVQHQLDQRTGNVRIANFF